jgi:hypothetical protein
MPEPGPLVFFSWGGPVMGGSLMLIDRRFTLGAPDVVGRGVSNGVGEWT